MVHLERDQERIIMRHSEVSLFFLQESDRLLLSVAVLLRGHVEIENFRVPETRISLLPLGWQLFRAPTVDREDLAVHVYSSYFLSRQVPLKLAPLNKRLDRIF